IAEPLNYGESVRDRIVLGDAVAGIGPGQDDFAAGALPGAAASCLRSGSTASLGGWRPLGQQHAEAAETSYRQDFKLRSHQGTPPDRQIGTLPHTQTVTKGYHAPRTFQRT